MGGMVVQRVASNEVVVGDKYKGRKKLFQSLGGERELRRCWKERKDVGKYVTEEYAYGEREVVEEMSERKLRKYYRRERWS